LPSEMSERKRGMVQASLLKTSMLITWCRNS
jgi:hypothetical protein